MKRLPNWETLLAAHFESCRTRAFAWGTFDCALATTLGMAAITGISDPGATYRGTYSDEAGALKIVGGDLGKFSAGICAALGFPEHPRPTFARRGDVALVNNGVLPGQPSVALGTVDLSGRYALCVGPRGFVRVPMKRWLRAWKIA